MTETTTALNTSFRPGQIWLDTTGNRIQAHGGSIITGEDGVFYWYGENKEKTTPGSGIWHWGVRAYSSSDLYNWEDRGLIIPPVPEDPTSPLHPAQKAPVELAGSAAGVQQTASRLGAALGVAVLGAIMAATTAAAFASSLDTSGLPTELTGPLKELASTTVAGGVASIPPDSSTQLAHLIQGLTDTAFLSGMSTTLRIAAGICVVCAAVALLVRPKANHDNGA